MKMNERYDAGHHMRMALDKLDNLGKSIENRRLALGQAYARISALEQENKELKERIGRYEDLCDMNEQLGNEFHGD